MLCIYHRFFLEHQAQPEIFSNIAVGAWWAVETITSLGYGDAVPVTTAGRFFASMVALWGIVLFSIPGAILGSGFIEIMLEHQQQLENQQSKKLLNQISTQIDKELHCDTASLDAEHNHLHGGTIVQKLDQIVDNQVNLRLVCILYSVIVYSGKAT